MSHKESVKDFIARLKSLPDADITDPEVLAAFCIRMRNAIRPEIEKIMMVVTVGNVPFVYSFSV